MSRDARCRLYILSCSCAVFRDDIDDYEEEKNDTIEQLKDMKESLAKMVKGNVSLVDSANAMQLVSHFLYEWLHDTLAIKAGVPVHHCLPTRTVFTNCKFSDC